MNEISNRLLFDGYKSLTNKIDDAHYQIDAILKSMDKIRQNASDSSERLDERIDEVHERITEFEDECDNFEETSDLTQELSKRIEVVLTFCLNHSFNLEQFKAILNGMYKSYRDMNG